MLKKLLESINLTYKDETEVQVHTIISEYESRINKLFYELDNKENTIKHLKIELEKLNKKSDALELELLKYKNPNEWYDQYKNKMSLVATLMKGM